MQVLFCSLVGYSKFKRSGQVLYYRIKELKWTKADTQNIRVVSKIEVEGGYKKVEEGGGGLGV